VGSTEVILVLLLAAVVLGPRRVAETARKLGKLVRDLRNYWKALTEDLGHELDVLADLKDTKKDLQALRSDLKR
jgi:sec-independent protein translocase protein TatB